MRHLALGSMFITVSAVALAQQNSIQIENAWSREAMAGRTGVVYLTVTDTGAPDRLTGVTSPIAAQVGLHESFTDNGIAKMRDVAALPVEPGKPVALAPGGYHIMLTGLKQPLKAGDTFPVTLSFEKSGPITTSVTVQKAGDRMMGHDAMGSMKMPDMSLQGGATGKQQ